MRTPMRRVRFAVVLLVLLAATPASTQTEEEFRPSTRVPADEAIAFPVDI